MDFIIKAKDTEDFPLVLCGNKSDLSNLRQVRNFSPQKFIQKKVQEETAKEYAKKRNCLYFETSAKARINVEEAFEALVLQAIQYRKEMEVLDFLQMSI